LRFKGESIEQTFCLRGRRKLKLQPTTIRLLAKRRTVETVQFPLKAGVCDARK
jgi:hypothetical protein